MHDPVSLLAMRCASGVKYKSFPHPNPLGVAKVDCFIPPCRLPESSCRGSICSSPCWVLLILVAEKVPFILWTWSYSTYFCMSSILNLAYACVDKRACKLFLYLYIDKMRLGEAAEYSQLIHHINLIWVNIYMFMHLYWQEVGQFEIALALFPLS